MNDPTEIVINPWPHIYRFTVRTLGNLQIGANLVGAGIVTSYFIFFDQALPFDYIKRTIIVVGIMFAGLVMIASGFMHRWQRDLTRFILLKKQGQEIDSDLHASAQRKILNLPYLCSLTSLFNWLLAAITMSIYSSILAAADANGTFIFATLRVFVGVIIAGIITCTLIFFTAEIFCRRIWPHFFPDGRMIQTAGAFRLKLRNRMLIIFVLASLLPIILMTVLSFNKANMMLTMNPEEVFQSLITLTAFLIAITMATTIILSRIFTASILNPVNKMENAMAKVEAGDFSAVVAVEANDELGALAEHFNQMTEGLKERYRLQRSLDLAKEVQQNLLPRNDPVVKGLDVAGESIYCDETGGDYFDYLSSSEWGPSKFGVLIGDVSGHGIPSALLMATARAFMRQRSSRSGSMAEVVTDVNRQITRDVEETGRFMTLFYLMIDLDARNMSWVRAGHDPAVWYDPATDRFEELHGDGMALGVDENLQFVQYQKSGLKEGQILLLSTDGLWETQNPAGNMFGKDRIYEIIRQKSDKSAREILDTIVMELDSFRQNLEPEDDITLVVIKVAE
jgi:sigma-B regulation protein RsbU (phosphoserine phosphatase)